MRERTVNAGAGEGAALPATAIALPACLSGMAVDWHLALLLPVTLLAACLSPRWEGPPSDHFDGRQFHNEEPFDVGLWDLLRFYATREPGAWRRNMAIAPGPPPERRVGQGALALTFVNHATVLVQADGWNLLTDPIFSERASPVSWAGPKRHRPPGIAFADLPPIDVVVISHNHYDHLDLPTLHRLMRTHDPLFVVPAGDDVVLRAHGIEHVAALDWWQSVALPGGCALTAVPVKHWSGRRVLPSDRNLSLWAGFVFATRGGPVYFAGDTGYDDHFDGTRARFGPMRAAMLPIGAYEPRWLTAYQHMAPEEAVQAHRDLRAGFSLGIHHGTFEMADDGMHEPAAALVAAARTGLADPTRFPPADEGERYDIEPLEESLSCASPLRS